MSAVLPILDRVRFEGVWRRLGASDAASFEWVASAYADERRAYHGVEHVQECLFWFDQVSTLAERRDEVEAALVFHDAVYDSMGQDNEEQSAEAFTQLALAAGLSFARVQVVRELILCTKHHVAKSADQALLIDIDLAVLGAEPARFERFGRDVRREYAWVGDANYRRGRARVLGGLLARAAIYQTEFFRGRLEARARANLSCALAELRAQETA